MNIPFFFGAAAGGFVLMATVGIQALVALFSSIPLAKRRHLENPTFDLKRAHRRIAQVAVVTTVLVAVISALIIQFAPLSATAGYLFGMILAFVLSLKRMTPNSEQNQANFAESYADCYPSSDAAPDDTVSFSPPKQDKSK
ncbi:hypothetical protein [Oscillibacter sp.]|uniref:hypothetical protein n=1 Tax=Oscillibacter sp. TaxID=1945593 RepID=UPI002612C45A|nr:hypothetical protein [Oscillibacter sp.]MDD3346665.1 hypothetical protein [Oscillibacter sp.]